MKMLVDKNLDKLIQVEFIDSWESDKSYKPVEHYRFNVLGSVFDIPDEKKFEITREEEEECTKLNIWKG